MVKHNYFSVTKSFHGQKLLNYAETKSQGKIARGRGKSRFIAPFPTLHDPRLLPLQDSELLVPSYLITPGHSFHEYNYGNHLQHSYLEPDTGHCYL